MPEKRDFVINIRCIRVASIKVNMSKYKKCIKSVVRLAGKKGKIKISHRGYQLVLSAAEGEHREISI